MTIEDTKTEDSASLIVTRLPPGDIPEQAFAIANEAKHAVWAAGGDLMPDHWYLRGGLAIVYMLRAREPMNEAGLLASLLVSEFRVSDDETPARARIFDMELDDPSRLLVEAVRTNRRLLGLPPQLDLVPDGGTGETPSCDTCKDCGDECAACGAPYRAGQEDTGETP